MTVPKPLLKPALSQSKLHGSPMNKRWYESGLSDHLDGQINQLSRRGDVDALKQILELGFLSPDSCKTANPERLFSITNFWSQKAALGNSPLLNQWMAVCQKHFPDQAVANFRSLVSCGVSKTLTPEQADTLMISGIDACLKAGIPVTDSIRHFTQRVEGGPNGSVDKYNDCSILGAAFNQLEVTPLKFLVDGILDSQPLCYIPPAAKIHKPKDDPEFAGQFNHGAQINLIDFCIRARLSAEKMRIAVSALAINRADVKVEMGLSIERFCKSMHVMDESHFRNVAILLNGGADMRVAGKAHTRKTWGNKTLLHKLCELPDVRMDGDKVSTDELCGAIRALLALRKEDGTRVFDVDLQDASGNTPLHLVAAHSPKIAGLLLGAGASADLLNGQSMSSYQIAKEEGSDQAKLMFGSWRAITELPMTTESASVRRFSPRP